MEEKEFEDLDAISRKLLETLPKETLIEYVIVLFHYFGKAKAKLKMIKDILEKKL